MTDQRELDRLLGAYFVEGTNELTDRVIDAALDQIDHIQQRPAIRRPRRYLTMTTPARIAAAAVIGLLAVGGALYLIRPDRSTIGGPSPAPGMTVPSSQPAAVPSMSPGSSAAPTVSVPPQRATDWSATGNMSVGRSFYAATLLADGKVLVAGGSVSSQVAPSSAELYDPASRTWLAGGKMAGSHFGLTATRLLDGRVLVAGGDSVGPESPNSAELYDPVRGTWTKTGRMIDGGRGGHTATLLPDGRVLVAGGRREGDALATAELYDPATGSWTATGNMTTPRAGDTATLLPNGKVLVAGGGNGGNPLTSAELYDPVSGSWTASASMVDARLGHTATLLPDGNVLVAGGYTGGAWLASAELYDPIRGTWKTTGRMMESRGWHTATLLIEGKVLVVGGDSTVHTLGFRAGAELYDPASGSWTAIGSMATPRAAHTASLMLDGDVLVAGGYHGGDPLTSAEVFDPGSGN